MKTIETKRLILRNFKETDYNDLFEMLNQRKDELFESYPSITYENGVEHLKYRVNNDEFVALELKENHKVIGNIYLGNRDCLNKEIGYILNKDYFHQGYAFEAAYTMIQYEFSHGTHRIYGECDPRNISSWKLMERLSMKREAFFKSNVYFKKDENDNPIWQDTFVYAIENID